MDIAQKSETRHDFAPVLLFSLTLFMSACLMFILQPMFGKLLLPSLGGAASVWNTCMVFYQSILFLGYLYAHFLSNRFSIHRQFWVHGILFLLSLIFIPIGVAENIAPPTETDPTIWLLSVLVMAIGLPFFILSTTSPLLQKWFSTIGHRNSRDPYFLSIASNAGSLLALLSYPLIFEPNTGLTDQQQFWSVCFVILCALLAFCMSLSRQTNTANPVQTPHYSKLSEQPNITLKIKWLILSFIPSSLLIGTTNFISTDIASVPLLWIIPLALYLISFIIVFSKYNNTFHKWMVTLQPWIVTPFLIYFFSNEKLADYTLELALHLLVFFISIMICHGELALKRPNASYLTHYYLIMSFGGMLGGIFNNFIVPFIFNDLYEYPLMIIAALLLNPYNKKERIYLQGNSAIIILFSYMLFFATLIYFNYQHLTNDLALGLIIIAIVANYFIFHKNIIYLALYSSIIASCTSPLHPQANHALSQTRNFYGVLSVTENIQTDPGTQNEIMHTLYSGSTEHGAQLMDSNRLCTPLSYYGIQGPIGQLFLAYHHLNDQWQIGIVGLGSGGLGAYAKNTQNWQFYELNPAVIDIATNPQYFSYLKSCVNSYDIHVGDARLSLEKQGSLHFDLLVIDAFTSDSIPTHLLTREAIELYFSRLNNNGLVAFHISNHYLELKQVLSDHAEKLGLSAVIQEFRPEHKLPLVHKSDWVIMARNSHALQPLLNPQNRNWQRLQLHSSIQSWTDDFTSLASIWKL